MPYFSIVIPAYNRANLIHRPVRSILSQDFSDLELIVVDDGSTDPTRERILEFQQQDSRVKYIYQSNAERGAARNRGFQAASGKYVIFFDSDDEMCANHLSVLKSVIDQHPGIRFLSTKWKLVEGEKAIPLTIDTLKEGWHDGTIYLTGTHTGVMIAILKDNPNLKLFEEDRKYATLEDWMFLTDNILREKIYIINQYTVIVDNHDQRSSRTDNLGIIKKRLLARDWIRQHVKLTDQEEDILDGYSYRYCAIHGYLDANRSLAIKYTMKAIKKTGADFQLLLLLAKSLIGYKTIQKFLH